MAQGRISLKRVSVDKTNARIVVVAAVSAFLSVFFVVASVALFSQAMYQNKVIGVKKKSVSQLKTNLTARDSLVTSYKAFVNTPQNIIGGNPTGSGPNDGTNAKIVLDALPSKYDFPALASSLEKMLSNQRVKLQNLTGNDDEVAQAANSSSSTPQPVEVPFEVTAVGDFASDRNTVDALERSIRPFQVEKIQINGSQQELTLTVTGKTYYQPEKALNIKKKVVK
jgi:hypothetical protein